MNTGANGLIEAINGGIEIMLGIALGFRNFTNYMIGSPLYAGEFKQAIHAKT